MRSRSLLSLACAVALGIAVLCAANVFAQTPVTALAAPATRASVLVATFDAAWNIINDTHFDPTFGGIDWAAVRSELRPKAEAATNNTELRSTIREMLARLGLSHFALLTAEATEATQAKDLGGDVGLDVRPIDGRIVITEVRADSSAARAGVGPGWIVTTVEGEALGPVLSRVTAGLDGRRRATIEAWRAAMSRLRGPSGSHVQVGFLDARNRTVRRELERRAETGEVTRVGNLPAMCVRFNSERLRTTAGSSVGVVKFNLWMTPIEPQLQKAMQNFRDADGMVIDLRGNTGGIAGMLMGISGYFVGEQRVLGTMKTRESTLRFAANPRRVNAAGERMEPFAGPVAILTDGLTGSTSECFAGGMQGIGRARVFGETSMGQALPSLFDRLPNGDVLLHAFGDFVTAKGERLEGRGVIPDERAPLTREMLLAGQDPALAAALRWIEKQKS